MEKGRIKPFWIFVLIAAAFGPALVVCLVTMVMRPSTHPIQDWLGLAFFALMVILMNGHVIVRSRRRAADLQAKTTLNDAS
jgi:hypothetical protein